VVVSGSDSNLQVEGTGNSSFAGNVNMAKSLTYTASSGSPGPELYMFPGVTSMNRLILAHSPSYPTWGLGYDDPSDTFQFKAGGTTTASVALSSGNIISSGLIAGNTMGVGTGSPDARMQVVAWGGGSVRMGDGCGNTGYAGISMNGPFSGCTSYNILSSSSDQNLYLNRPSGYAMAFRENNADQMVISPGGLITTNGRLNVGSAPWGSVLTAHDIRAQSNVQIGNYVDPNSSNAGVVYNASGSALEVYAQRYDWPTAQFTQNGTVYPVHTTLASSRGYSCYSGTCWSGVGITTDGEVYKPGGGSWGSTSDRRTKRNVSPFTDGLDILKKIDAINYEYNGLGGTPEGMKGVGVIAQDAQKVVPYMVKSTKMKLHPTDKEDTDILSFDPSALPFINLNAIKELDARGEKQQSEIDALRAENAELRARLEAIEKKLGQ
jgi:hypothetical protein